FSVLLRSQLICFFFSSRRRHTSSNRDWSSDVCSSDLVVLPGELGPHQPVALLEPAGGAVHADPGGEQAEVLARGPELVPQPQAEIGRASCRERAQVPGGGVACKHTGQQGGRSTVAATT